MAPYIAVPPREDSNVPVTRRPMRLSLHFLVSASLPLAASLPLDEPRDLAPLIAPLLDKAQIPALGGAIVTSAGLEAIGAVGLRSAGAAEKVTKDDRWHLGSCTKAITATLAARLVEKGQIGWDTTIAQVFGETTPKRDPAWDSVTLLALLCHRSGASKNFDQELWERMVARGGALRVQRSFFAREGLALAPERRPNTETVYSNAGFMIAGAMIEKVADAPFEDLVRKEVFEPLGMTESGFGAPGTPGRLDQPLGHTRGEKGWTPIPLGPSADIPAAAGPAGTIHATLANWARFAQAHLRGARGDESFLKKATWATLHSPIAGGHYAPGWVVSREDWAGGKRLSHLGSNEFWVSEISLAPEKDFAVLLVTNLGDDAAERPFQELLNALMADHAARAK